MSDADLFGVRKSVRKQAAPAPKGAVHGLITLYIELYEREFHEKPVITKADGAILKSLALTYGEEKVVERLRAYFTLSDDFVRQSGYSIRVFRSKWNELAARLHKKSAKGGIPTAEETKERMRRLRESS